MKTSAPKGSISSHWPALVLIPLAAALFYSNICSYPFVFDDHSRIVENEQIRDLTGFLSIERILKPRAVVDLTFALNYRFGKLNVSGYHITNVFIHIINGLIAYFLAFTILRLVCNPAQSPQPPTNPPIPQFLNSSISVVSFFTALIFVAHPVQTQAVTYIVQRYASMAAMFYMGSVLFYLRARMIQRRQIEINRDSKPTVEGTRRKGRNKKGKSNSVGVAVAGTGENKKGTLGASPFRPYVPVFYSLSILCGMLAFLSKQNTASLPGAILLVEYLFIDRTWQGWKTKLPWIGLAFVSFLICVLYVTGLFSGGIAGKGLLEDVSALTQEAKIVSRWSYLCTQFNVVVTYIKLLFFPLHQNLDHLYPFKSGFLDDYTVPAFLFLAATTVFGVWNIRRRPVIAFGIFWFFIALSVESSIIPIRDALFEHRLYLPMFGFALLTSYLLFSILSRKRSFAVAVSVIIILVLGTTTYLRNRVWRDSIALWSDVVAKNPQNFRGYCNLGVALERQGRFEEAAGRYSRALLLKPDYPDALYNLGVVLALDGRFEQAIDHFSRALQIMSEHAEARNDLGVVLDRQGKSDEAERHFLEALQIRPDYADAHNNVGVVLERKGEFNEALKHYLEAVRIMPDFADAHQNLGALLARRGRSDEAISHFLEALRIKPDSAEINYRLGAVLVCKGRHEEAIKYFRKALEIEPDNAEAHYNLGVVLEQQGRHREAISHFSRALRIRPLYKKARRALERFLPLAGVSPRASKNAATP